MKFPKYFGRISAIFPNVQKVFNGLYKKSVYFVKVFLYCQKFQRSIDEIFGNITSFSENFRKFPKIAEIFKKFPGTVGPQNGRISTAGAQ